MTDYQPYDGAMKSLLGEEKAEILPHFLPKAEYISEQNIEIDRTTLRTDLVYNITYDLASNENAVGARQKGSGGPIGQL